MVESSRHNVGPDYSQLQKQVPTVEPVESVEQVPLIQPIQSAQPALAASSVVAMPSADELQEELTRERTKFMVFRTLRS